MHFSAKNLMGFAVVFLMAVAFISVLYVVIPEPNKDLVLVLAGAIASRFGTVVDYFFGSKAHEPGTTVTVTEESKP